VTPDEIELISTTPFSATPWIKSLDLYTRCVTHYREGARFG
jgi:hypothetical protein